MKSLKYGLASEIDVVVAGVVTASAIILSFFLGLQIYSLSESSVNENRDHNDFLMYYWKVFCFSFGNGRQVLAWGHRDTQWAI